MSNQGQRTYKCIKCKNNIPESNQFLHETQCQARPSDLILYENLLREQNRPQESVSNLTKSNVPKNNVKSSPDANINQIPQNKDSNNDIDDLYYCSKCDNYMPKQEEADHLLSHQFESQGGESSRVIRSRRNTDNEIQRTTNMQFRQNTRSNSNASM
jgi:DNA-directed RNA polymerase subunit RPC12/RpoP